MRWEYVELLLEWIVVLRVKKGMCLSACLSIYLSTRILIMLDCVLSEGIKCLAVAAAVVVELLRRSQSEREKKK